MTVRTSLLEADLIFACEDRFATRADVAMLYGAAIRYEAPVDWSRVNAAILERWSKSALVWIKREAWKRCLDTPSGSKP